MDLVAGITYAAAAYHNTLLPDRGRDTCFAPTMVMRRAGGGVAALGRWEGVGAPCYARCTRCYRTEVGITVFAPRIVMSRTGGVLPRRSVGKGTDLSHRRRTRRCGAMAGMPALH